MDRKWHFKTLLSTTFQVLLSWGGGGGGGGAHQKKELEMLYFRRCDVMKLAREERVIAFRFLSQENRSNDTKITFYGQ